MATKLFDEWINLDDQSLEFGEYVQIGCDIDELWNKASQVSMY